MRVELLRPFPLLGMPKLVQDSRASQASHLTVVGKAPVKRREIPDVAAELVAAEAPRPVGEGVGDLEVAETHDEVATDVLGDVATAGLMSC